MSEKSRFPIARAVRFAPTTRRAVTTGLMASVAAAGCKWDDITGEEGLASPASAATPAATSSSTGLLAPQAATISTSVPFVDELLRRPGIASPSDPFVMIFHMPDRDGGYPFITGAPMTRDHWAQVYQHIGHIGPFELMRLSDVRTSLWGASNKVPFEVAQGVGRPTGGGFFGIPSGGDEDTARRLYRDPIGLNITHWLHDDEFTTRDQIWMSRMKQWYVDEMLAPRRSAGKAAPQLITNWEADNARHNDAVGGLSGFRSIGFTAGNFQYYSYRTDSGADVLREIMVGRPQSIFQMFGASVLKAVDDQAKFGASYVGIAEDNGRPTPLPADEWGSVVTLGTLEGMRSYFIFTPQSSGTLGNSGASYRDQGIFNAQSLYAMANAGRQFESTKNSFKDSTYAGDAALLDKSDNVLFRSRRNGSDMWFGGVAFSGSASVRVQTPAATGTLTNLATGARQQVSGGVATVPLSRTADLYHFR
ncbi:MAG: hypothetical protein JNJ73_07340 [Hyphomonadaceae bacterium]|nr:hypothetical protein [Hyphomonadaceae bacterium]